MRDKNGTAVEAEAYPAFLVNGPKFSSSQAPCTNISSYGIRSIGLAYALANGGLDGCQTNPPAGTWRESTSANNVYFADDRCDGQTYTFISYGPTLKVGPSYFYVDGPPTITTTTPVYKWNTNTSACMSSGTFAQLWAYKPVPEDIVNLLPAAPYTLELVY